jgi:hypothetical protein
MRDDMLQNGASASRLAVYCYFPWVASEFRYLSRQFRVRRPMIGWKIVRALEPIEVQTAGRLRVGC